MDTTINLELPYIIAAQAQKHVTHNEALRSLDAIVQLMVLDKDLTSPPGSPAEGARYIVAAGSGGAWAGQAGKIAAFQDGAWAFYAPHEGWLAWVADEDELYAYSGSAWVLLAGGGGGIAGVVDDTSPQLGGNLDANAHSIGFDDGTGITDDAGNEQVVFHKTASAVNQIGITNAATANPPAVAAEGGDTNIDLLLAGKGTGHPKAALFGVNAAADATTRFAVAAAASLFNHAGNGHQHKINKAAAGDTASLLFQTGFSGRAEMGTAGDDDFHVKVSADGSSWTEALVVSRATGRMTLAADPTASLGAATKQYVDAAVAGVAGVSDGDKGDIVVSGSGAAWTIDNDAVTYAKLQNVSAASRILGRKTASAGDAEECTLSDVLDFIGSAAEGDILYRGASAWSRLARGSNGQVLTLASGVPAWAAPTGGREKLAADRTYYVRSDGNDSNAGLSNTSGGAFLTIQKAVDVAASIDLGIYNVTIQIANGTWTSQIVLKATVGAGKVIIKGDSSTPSNVTLNVAGASAIAAAAVPVGWYELDGLKIVSGVHGILADSGCKGLALDFKNLDFGTCSAYHIVNLGGASLRATGDYAISGNAGYHWYFVYPGSSIEVVSRTITLSGTPAFASAFAAARRLAGLRVNGITFSGSATGPRYLADGNGHIFTNGGGASYFPGNSAGSTATGGQYE